MYYVSHIKPSNLPFTIVHFLVDILACRPLFIVGSLMQMYATVATYRYPVWGKLKGEALRLSTTTREGERITLSHVYPVVTLKRSQQSAGEHQKEWGEKRGQPLARLSGFPLQIGLGKYQTASVIIKNPSNSLCETEREELHPLLLGSREEGK